MLIQHYNVRMSPSRSAIERVKKISQNCTAHSSFQSYNLRMVLRESLLCFFLSLVVFFSSKFIELRPSDVGSEFYRPTATTNPINFGVSLSESVRWTNASSQIRMCGIWLKRFISMGLMTWYNTNLSSYSVLSWSIKLLSHAAWNAMK